MRILILCTARSGSTNLAKTLGGYFNLPTFFEPFLEHYIGKPYNSKGPQVLKTMIWDTDLNIIKPQNFDYTIYLTRKNIKEAAESHAYQTKYNHHKPDHWHRSYVYDKSINIEKQYNWLKKYFDQLHDLSNNITYYEDIYSGDEIIVRNEFKKIGLDIDYNKIKYKLDPIFKYRRKNNTLL